MKAGEGRWFLLENCHLASKNFLTALEKFWQSLCTRDPPPPSTFRLWLTSNPSHCSKSTSTFPKLLLKNCHVVVCHTPAPLHKCTVLCDQDDKSGGEVQKVDNDLKDCLKYVQEIDYQAACHPDWWQGGMCLERTGDIRNGVRSLLQPDDIE